MSIVCIKINANDERTKNLQSRCIRSSCRWGRYWVCAFLCLMRRSRKGLTRAEAVFHPPLSFTSFSTAAKCSMLVSEPLRASFCWKEDICCQPDLSKNVWKSKIKLYKRFPRAFKNGGQDTDLSSQILLATYMYAYGGVKIWRECD